jgi:hypothetical protein
MSTSSRISGPKVLDQLKAALATFVEQVPVKTIPEADALRADAQLQLAQAKSLIG